jgi:hypothetical protein
MLSRLFHYWLHTCITCTIWSACLCSLFKWFCCSFLILTHSYNPILQDLMASLRPSTTIEYWIVHHEKLVNASVKFSGCSSVFFFIVFYLLQEIRKTNSYGDDPELTIVSSLFSHQWLYARRLCCLAQFHRTVIIILQCNAPSFLEGHSPPYACDVFCSIFLFVASRVVKFDSSWLCGE